MLTIFKSRLLPSFVRALLQLLWIGVGEISSFPERLELAGFGCVAPFLDQLGMAGTDKGLLISVGKQHRPRDRSVFKAVFQPDHQAFGARLGVAIQARLVFFVGAFFGVVRRKAAAQGSENGFEGEKDGVDPVGMVPRQLQQGGAGL